MIASASPEHYAAAIEAVGNDPNVDSVVAIYIPPLVTDPEQVATAIATAAGTLPAHVPIATVFMSSKGAPAVLAGGPRGKLPSYSFPENAALALASAVRYGAWRARPRGATLSLARDGAREIRRIIDAATARSASEQWLPPGELAQILNVAGIALAAQAASPADPATAAAIATDLGFPLVAKAVSPTLVHKSDIGGVILGLESASAVAAAVPALADRLRAAGHTLDQVLLQRQIEGGVEAFVGVTTDPSLGPIVVAGMGGVHVELLRDVAFRLTPVSDLDATEMLDGLRTGRLLDGYRGAARADRPALAHIIQRVSALVEVIPELLDFELNPVRVMAEGKGVIAVDARMRIGPARATEQTQGAAT
jgi:acyl-CoA synthetase (NDP forming)